MSKKVRKHVMLSSDVVDRIVSKGNKEGISDSQVVEDILRDYFNNDESIDERLDKMDEVLKRIWLTGNVIDRHTKMMIEFWNHYFFVKKYDAFATTEKIKAKEVVQSENLIRKRIAESRQRKIDTENKQ